MKFINLSDARKSWSDLIDHVQNTREKICLTRYKEPVAYIIPIDDVLDLLELDTEETIDKPFPLSD